MALLPSGARQVLSLEDRVETGGGVSVTIILLKRSISQSRSSVR